MSSSGPISAALQDFIARHIGSLEQLEILCLLNQNPERAWSISEVFRQIQSSERSVAECLESFRNQGLLASNAQGSYCFSPRSPDTAALISDLCRLYRERRVTVVELIYRKPADPIQDFADAFKLRKKP